MSGSFAQIRRYMSEPAHRVVRTSAKYRLHQLRSLHFEVPVIAK